MKRLTLKDKKTILRALDRLAFEHFKSAEACRRCTQPDGDTDDDEERAKLAEAEVTALRERLAQQWAPHGE